MSRPKLTIELVPEGQWGANLRSELPRHEWDALRHETYRQAGFKCEICGGKGPKHPVECHEIWEYDDDKHFQRLKGLIALCPACHRVKHIGHTFHRDPEAGFQAILHMAKVNGWTKDEALGHVDEAMLTWQRRSMRSWTLDLSWLDRQREPGHVLAGGQRSLPVDEDDLDFMDDPNWRPE